MAKTELLDKYNLQSNDMDVEVEIIAKETQPVPNYNVNITNISENTKIILEKIREEFISTLDLRELERKDDSEKQNLKERFSGEIKKLIRKYFPDATKQTENALINYLIQQNLGLGRIEILLTDQRLEEIVVNNHQEPIWVYHKKYGWLKSNIKIPTESRIRHYSTMIGREVNKEITTLNPLMDAHLLSGDRVNATLQPISSRGNTITIRKFAEDPWTITKFIKNGTISRGAAAFIWLALENELSIMIAGGTGSGKTSMLNVVANFLPPNQRVISIEDTRELSLPDNLHWVPMETRLPNPEGKGGVSMIDLLVNSLRMRPDRIVVGEIRRNKEAQVLMEAMHTGHSVYATIHANNAAETVTRLTNPPIDIPKKMLSSLGMILVQNRNRRTGNRRTLQIAEVTDDGNERVIMQHDSKKDTLEKVAASKYIIEEIELYTGMSKQEIMKNLKEKEAILKWMVDEDIDDIDKVGKVMANYYMGRLKVPSQ